MSSKKEETMMTRYFYAHGSFCASRPWEVIIGMMTLTVCTMSMSLLASTRRVCGLNYNCSSSSQPLDDTRSSDTIILTITRCMAVIYLYLQFRKMRKLGSKYLLGMAGVFTIASSVIFSVAVINIIGADLTGLHEALPFFLLLVDLSKACTLAKVAFSAMDEDEVVLYIARGMSKLGPELTLDTVVETLVIGVGTLSGIRTLETMCCFGCLSVVANYLAFMTFYPACLALILEVTRGQRALVHLRLIMKVWQDEEDNEKPNPVAQRVKLIMSAGLVFVHVHSRLFVSSLGDSEHGKATSLHQENTGGAGGNFVNDASIDLASQLNMPDVSLWWFYITKLASLSADYVLTLVLAVLLSIKYVFFDDETSNSRLALNQNGLHHGHIGENGSIGKHVHSQNDNSVLDKGFDSTTTLTGEGDDEISSGVIVADVLETEVREGHVIVTEAPLDPSSSLSGSSRGSPCPTNTKFLVGDSSDDDDVCIRKNSNKICVSIETQTDSILTELNSEKSELDHTVQRDVKECLEVLNSEIGASGLTDEELLQLVACKHIPPYKLESVLGDHERGVAIRRKLVTGSIGKTTALKNLPYTNYDYKCVDGACCENVIGYMPVPVGVAGPLLLDGKHYTIPMATTEGCLVASTNRGCRALSSGTGVMTTVYRDGMARAPVVRFPSAQRASEVHRWLEDKDNYDLVADAFDSTSRFARLQKLQIIQVSRTLYIRFLAVTGDAMGMNMLSKGSEKALTMLQEKFFPDMEILSLSGNVCTDKKPSALNWIEGRGKSVVAEAVVSSDVIKNVLKTSVTALVDLNVSKNLIGSAAAGSIGGFNAQAANIVTAIYIATGQDPAQNVCSSNCITVMEPTGPNNEDLYISCTMPSIEVGTVGGGTVLPPQAACLEMLGLRGSHKDTPGRNAADLARIVCAAVMAGELSLMSALAAGHLVRSHLKHNRSVQNMAPGDVTTLSASALALPRRGSAAASISTTTAAATDCGTAAASCAAPSSRAADCIPAATAAVSRLTTVSSPCHDAVASSECRRIAATPVAAAPTSAAILNNRASAKSAIDAVSKIEPVDNSVKSQSAVAATTIESTNDTNIPAAVTAAPLTSAATATAASETYSADKSDSSPDTAQDSAREPGTCLKLIS